MKKTFLKYLLIFILSSLQAQEVCELSIKQFDSIIAIASKAVKQNNVVHGIKITDSLIKIVEDAGPEGKDYILGNAYNIVGMSNVFLDDKEQALYNFKKALKYAESINNDRLKIKIFNNIGGLYVVKYENYQAALNYYYQGLEKAKKIKDTAVIDILSVNIGESLMYTNKYDKGIKYIRPIAEKLDTIEDPFFKSFAYHLMARYHMHKELYEKSEAYFAKALAIDDSLNFHRGMYRNYKNAAELFASKKQHDTAYVLLAKAAKIKDSLVANQSKAQKAAISAKFQIEEYQRSLTELKIENIQVIEKSNKRQKYNIINIIISLVLVSLLGTLLYFFLERRKSQKLLVNQNKELEIQKNRAEQLSKTKSQFISTVSHELRTPMYGVIGLTSILIENNRLNKKDMEYLKSLKFSSDYLLHLINDVLEISKIESRKIQLQSTPFDIKKLLENIINPFENDANERGNSIHIVIPGNIPRFLRSDTVRLSQILFNLIGNAVKFTEEGDIWVRLSLQEELEQKVRILFEVADNGPGIPKDQHEKIFESFAQLERYENENSFKGTGLGLAIVSKLISLFESEIKLESEVGKGTTFSFSLLLETATTAATKEDKQVELVFGDYKILVAEDNKISQIVTRKILEKENLQCDIVSDGRAAVDAVKNKEYDLILMDLHMPIMDGVVATRAIRKFNKKIPIIALTASDIEDAKREIIDNGIDDFIIKPFDNYVFYQKIHKYCTKIVSYSS